MFSIFFAPVHFESSLGQKKESLNDKEKYTPPISDGSGESTVLPGFQERNGKGGSGVKARQLSLPASSDKTKKRKQTNLETKSKDEENTVTKGKTKRRKRAAIREYPLLSYPRLTECELLGDVIRKTARLELTALVKRFEQDKEIRPCLVAIVEAVKKLETKSKKLDTLGVKVDDVRAQMQGRREKMKVFRDIVERLEAEDLAWDQAEKAIETGDLGMYGGPTLPPNIVNVAGNVKQGGVDVDGSGVSQCFDDLIGLVRSCEAMAERFATKLSKNTALIHQAQQVQSQLYGIYERLKFKGYPNIDDQKSAMAAISKK